MNLFTESLRKQIKKMRKWVFGTPCSITLREKMHLFTHLGHQGLRSLLPPFDAMYSGQYPSWCLMLFTGSLRKQIKRYENG